MAKHSAKKRSVKRRSARKSPRKSVRRSAKRRSVKRRSSRKSPRKSSKRLRAAKASFTRAVRTCKSPKRVRAVCKSAKGMKKSGGKRAPATSGQRKYRAFVKKHYHDAAVMKLSPKKRLGAIGRLWAKSS